MLDRIHICDKIEGCEHEKTAVLQVFRLSDDFMKSYLSLFLNYANFSGCMKRKAYWTAMLCHALILLIPLYPAVRRFVDPAYVLPSFYIPWVLPIWCFYNILMVIPLWSAAVRRLHTLPRSGWWLLIGLIPLAGWFLVLSWLFQKGSYEEYMWRLKKAGPATFEEKRRETERPRNGGWFFPVFILLAVSGWFLNRQIMQIGSVDAALADLREKSEMMLKMLPREKSSDPLTPGETALETPPKSIIIYVRDASFDTALTPPPGPGSAETPVPEGIIPTD